MLQGCPLLHLTSLESNLLPLMTWTLHGQFKTIPAALKPFIYQVVAQRSQKPASLQLPVK